MSIAVIFGGKSCEHSISVVTGVQLLNAIKELNPVPVYVQADGEWVTGKELFELSYYKSRQKKKLKKVHFEMGSNVLCGNHFKSCTIDCAVLCCHGMNGEDGSLQGLLTLCNVPYTGSSIASSAVCLDKVLMKKVLKANGLPLLPYVQFSREQFNKNTCRISEQIEKIGMPVIVKPARQGSSIGVQIAHDEKELVSAVRTAFSYDNKVLVEKALTQFTELNCAVIGGGSNVIVSEVEKPIGWTDILTFKDKYGDAKTSGKREFPAKIPDKLTEKIRGMSAKAFEVAELSGVVRIDYMLSEDGKLWLNEINTIPGSLSTYLFKPKYTEKDIVLKLIEIARVEKTRQDRLTYAFNAELFSCK